ncbi:uncharacterized protein TNCV_3594301 [Trichonephila clavipes]|nr:uncharacterized protein TNCV_3594301 [Trichonephila clavipes]
MPLRHFRRQYEQLSQFERGRIIHPIGMMEAGLSARRVAHQLGRSDCVTSRREDFHIVRNALEQPTASSAALQAQILPSLGPLCLLEPYKGAWLRDIWDRGAHYVCCLWLPPIDASVWSGATHEETGLQRNETNSL